jgi:hypothetical protein
MGDSFLEVRSWQIYNGLKTLVDYSSKAAQRFALPAGRIGMTQSHYGMNSSKMRAFRGACSPVWCTLCWAAGIVDGLLSGLL